MTKMTRSDTIDRLRRPHNLLAARVGSPGRSGSPLGRPIHTAIEGGRSIRATGHQQCEGGDLGLTLIQRSSARSRPANPKIALVLAGGAVAGGAFKVGGLQALDECLTGISGGNEA